MIRYRNVNHFHSDHVPCARVCTSCLGDVLCNSYLANDNACDACVEKAVAAASVDGGFFPKGVVA